MQIVEIVSCASASETLTMDSDLNKLTGRETAASGGSEPTTSTNTSSDLERPSSPHLYLRINPFFRSSLTYRSALCGRCNVHVCIQLEAQCSAQQSACYCRTMMLKARAQRAQRTCRACFE